MRDGHPRRPAPSGAAFCLFLGAALVGCTGGMALEPAEQSIEIPARVSFHRVRMELSTTDEGARITFEDSGSFLTARLKAVEGGPGKHGVTMQSLWVARGSTAGATTSITTDFAVSPELLHTPIRCLFESRGTGSSILRVLRDADERRDPIQQVSHPGGEPFAFSLDLSALENEPPLVAEIQSVAHRKQVFAFYYPWYGELEYWRGNPILQDSPASPYVSHDPAAIARHIDEAKSAGIDGFIASWWGPGSYADENLEALLNIADQKEFAVLVDFETADFDPRTGEAILRGEDTYFEWLRHLLSTHGCHPSFYRVAGKPVITFFVSYLVPDGTWKNVFTRLREQGLDAIFLAEYGGQSPKLESLDVCDGFHVYNVLNILSSVDQVSAMLAPTYSTTGRAVRFYPLLTGSSLPKIWTATVQPGYDDHLIPGRKGEVLPREDGAFFTSVFAAAAASDPDWILVTSWNEWPEHTYIEPSELYGQTYLEIMRGAIAEWR